MKVPVSCHSCNHRVSLSFLLEDLVSSGSDAKICDCITSGLETLSEWLDLDDLDLSEGTIFLQLVALHSALIIISPL